MLEESLIPLDKNYELIDNIIHELINFSLCILQLECLAACTWCAKLCLQNSLVY